MLDLQCEVCHRPLPNGPTYFRFEYYRENLIPDVIPRCEDHPPGEDGACRSA